MKCARRFSMNSRVKDLKHDRTNVFYHTAIIIMVIILNRSINLENIRNYGQLNLSNVTRRRIISLW